MKKPLNLQTQKREGKYIRPIKKVEKTFKNILKKCVEKQNKFLTFADPNGGS
ncbi:hypothetical protein [Echinicola shivajiensis]|uniref:hypothetical protein n=1 Tax=Echinicola shivajiensis TaxID=1035916 RepID=UPI001BFCC4AB|nr:hypothetical protein [Echinicola shivajiensis]